MTISIYILRQVGTPLRITISFDYMDCVHARKLLRLSQPDTDYFIEQVFLELDEKGNLPDSVTT